MHRTPMPRRICWSAPGDRRWSGFHRTPSCPAMATASRRSSCRAWGPIRGRSRKSSLGLFPRCVQPGRSPSKTRHSDVIVQSDMKLHVCLNGSRMNPRESTGTNLQTGAVAPALHGATQPHILAVGDDATVRELLSDYLGRNDFRVTAVADGRAMRTVLAERIVDLLLLDLKLPGEDGMTLAQRLRTESAIPIIMLSGRGDEADRVMGLELGADDYVTKPFSPRELLARIRTVLRRRRAEVKPGRPKDVRAYRFDGWELNL